MRLLIGMILCSLFCVPIYPFVIFAEWYSKSTTLGAKFNFKMASADYWRDVKEVLSKGKMTK